MSYILDALRKADAQRERDASRGIHAQPAPPGSPSSPASRWLGWGAAAAGVAAIVVAGLYVTRNDAPPSNPVAATRPAPMPPAAMQAAEPVKMQPPQEVAKAIQPPPPVVVPPSPQAVTAARVSADERARQAREAAFGRNPGGAGPAPMPAPAPAPPGVAAAPQPAQASPAAAVPAGITGLPPDAPRVAISGGVYSASPAQRMLIVNGQVFNEGSEVAPGLTIEKIDPKTAVLKFRGSSYTVSY